MVHSLQKFLRCLVLISLVMLFAASAAWTAEPEKNEEARKANSADQKATLLMRSLTLKTRIAALAKLEEDKQADEAKTEKVEAKDDDDDAAADDEDDGDEAAKEKKALEEAKKALGDARKKLAEAKTKNAEAKKTAEEAKKTLSDVTKEYTEAVKKYASLRKGSQNEAVLAAQKAYEEQRRAEQERLKNDPKWQPACEPAEVIKIGDKKNAPAIHSFCLNEDGNLLVCTGGLRTAYDPETRKAEQVEEAMGIHVLEPLGKSIAVWPMKFEPQAICAGNSGVIFVGGDGKLLKLDKDGKELAQADAPNVTELSPLVDEKDIAPETDAEKKAREEKLADLQKKFEEVQKEYQKLIEEARKDLKENDEPSQKAFREKIQEPQSKLIAASQELNAAQQTPQMKAAQERAMRKQKLTINSIAVAGDDVFITCPMTKTYGFAVWRTDLNYANPKKIIEGLAGCCGQMDIKAKDGEVWVAHNGRHKVERYDRDGKLLSSFGKADRVNAEGFGGCCEPKNLRFGSGGDLLACESGPPTCIKRFSVDGNFVGVLAIAPWTSGCVRVTVDATPDGSRYYILHSDENTIQVFTPKKSEAESKKPEETK
jgi:hypothetical protein